MKGEVFQQDLRSRSTDLNAVALVKGRARRQERMTKQFV